MPSRLNKNGGLNFVFVGFVIMALALSAFTAKAAGEGGDGGGDDDINPPVATR